MTEIVANISKKQPINATFHRHTINAVAYKTGPKGEDGLTVSVNGIHEIEGNITVTADDIPETDSRKYVPTPPLDEHLFLNGDLEWRAASVGSGGYASNLYFTTLDSDVLGYKIIDYSFEPTETILQIPATTTETLIRTYLFPHEIATNIIDAGLWGMNYRCMVDKTAGVTRLAFESFVRHTDETETTLFKAYSDEINNTVMTTIRQETNQPSFTVDETDRFGCRIYAVTTHQAGVTISTVVGDGHASYFNIPIKLRHSQLRDFNEDENYQHINQTEKDRLNNYIVSQVKESGYTQSSTMHNGKVYTYIRDEDNVIIETSIE